MLCAAVTGPQSSYKHLWKGWISSLQDVSTLCRKRYLLEIGGYLFFLLDKVLQDDPWKGLILQTQAGKLAKKEGSGGKSGILLGLMNNLHLSYKILWWACKQVFPWIENQRKVTLSVCINIAYLSQKEMHYFPSSHPFLSWIWSGLTLKFMAKCHSASSCSPA